MSGIITSRENPEWRMACSLRTRKGRAREGLFLVEGEKQVREALRAGVPCFRLYLDADRLEQVSEVRSLVPPETVRILRAPLFRALSDTVHSQPVILAAEVRDRPLESLDWSRDLLVADAVQDPGNLGTILRTAVAAGIDQAVLLPGTVDVYNPKVVRAAAGALFGVSLFPDAPDHRLLGELARRRIPLVCAHVKGDRDLFSLEAGGPLALVVGNENQGPRPAVLAAADWQVRIPMCGPVESLNASVAAALLIYEVFRRRRTV